jgi:outer membrane protein assembly factor BamB
MAERPNTAGGPRPVLGAAGWTAVVAGAFAAVTGALVARSAYALHATDPLVSPELERLRARLQDDPANVSLRRDIRALDLSVRRTFYRRQWFVRVGTVLLVAGLGVFLAAGHAEAGRRRAAPYPGTGAAEGDDPHRAAVRARWAVGALALAAAGGGAAAWLSARGTLRPWGLPELAAREPAGAGGRPDGAPTGAPTSRPTSYPAPNAVAANWPRFRGPGGRGIWTGDDVPVAWDANSGRGILWKTPIGLPGNSSPVVWGDRVYLTGADQTARKVYCLHANSGEVLWERAVETVAGDGFRLDDNSAEQTGYAAPTPVTDGQRVYAIFANGDLICFDAGGREQWSTNLGPLKNAYGHASSLAMHRNLLLVQLDQKQSQGATASALRAFEGATGAEVWSAHRQIDGSWMSPIVIHPPGGAQIIAGGNPYLIAHDPADGNVIWRAKVLGTDPAPSPVFAGGLVYVVQPYGNTTAVRPDGRGDVTETHVAWSVREGYPDTCSPLSDGKLLWLLGSDGFLMCHDARDGSTVYEQDLRSPCKASPSLAGGRLYVLGLDGVMIIAEAGRAFRRIARCAIGERTAASPAFADGRIYLRRQKHLFCVGGGE